MKHLVVGLLLLALTRSDLTSQTIDDKEFDVQTKKGIEHIYNLDFEKAESEFTQLVKLRPKDPSGHFFLAMVDWWRILIDMDNEQYDQRFFDALDKVIDLCDELLDKNERDVNALFFKGGAVGFKGRLKFHRDDWFAAAGAGRKALPIVQDASAYDPKNYDILLGSGIYNYYAEVIPQLYPVAKPLMLFIPAGDKKRGIQQLKTASEKGKYAGIESSYFLMQIYYAYEKDYQSALTIARDLTTRFPNNPLFHKYLGRCYVSLANWPSVQQVFAEIVGRVRKGQRGYTAVAEREAEYYLGMCDMNARQFEAALRHFYRCDELSRSLDKKEISGFMVMANLKTGQSYDMLSKRDLAVAQYKKVLAMKEYQDSHRQAERFVSAPYAQ
jgi:tetratricopeptide (TPR) repeat protein